MSVFRKRRDSAPCTIEVSNTFESLHAHVRFNNDVKVDNGLVFRAANSGAIKLAVDDDGHFEVKNAKTNRTRAKRAVRKSVSNAINQLMLSHNPWKYTFHGFINFR